MSKRVATEGRDGREAVTKGDLDDLFATQREEVTKIASGIVERANSELKQGFLASQRALLENYHDTQVAPRFDSLEETVEQLKSRIAKLEGDQAQQKESIETINRDIARSSTDVVTQHELDAEEWDRPPRLNELKLGTAVKVTLASVREATSEWLQRLSLPQDSWRFEGPITGRRWRLVFTGSPIVAARRANAANGKLFDEPTGKWKEITVQLPLKEPSERTKLFIGLDQSDRTVAQNAVGRKIAKLLETEGHNVFYDQKLNTVFAKGAEAPIAKVVIDGKRPEDRKIFWDFGMVTEMGIDKPAIMRSLENPRSLRMERVEWRL